jgi:hypothetical protein
VAAQVEDVGLRDRREPAHALTVDRRRRRTFRGERRDRRRRQQEQIDRLEDRRERLHHGVADQHRAAEVA